MCPSPLKYMPPVGMRHGIKNITRMLFSGNAVKNIEIQIGKANFHHVIAFNSGKAALLTSLRSLMAIQSSRNEVIIPAYTCFSIASVIESAGLRVVLCDIEPETLDFDYEMLSELMNEKILCIIPTHLFGLSADISRTKSLAVRYGAYVIEDSAQSISGSDVNSDADITVFSLGRGKPLSAGGGGLLATNQDAIIKAIQYESIPDVDNSFPKRLSIVTGLLLNDFLICPYVYGLPASLPFLKIGKTIYPDYIKTSLMPSYKKIFVNSLMQKHAELSENRYEKTQFYYRKLKSIVASNRLIHAGQSYYHPIRYPFYLPSTVLDLPSRAVSKMKKLGIVRMYPCGLHRLERIQKFWVNKSTEFPGTDWVAEHLLSLPVHPLIKKQDQVCVVNYIQCCVKK